MKIAKLFIACLSIISLAGFVGVAQATQYDESALPNDSSSTLVVVFGASAELSSTESLEFATLADAETEDVSSGLLASLAEPAAPELVVVLETSSDVVTPAMVPDTGVGGAADVEPMASADVPEPTTLLLMGIGLLAIVGLIKRKKR